MKKYDYQTVKDMFTQRDYELISKEYVSCEEPLEYICNKHREKGIQDIDFSHFKRGQGCRFCGKENKRNGKEKDLEEYNAKELTESKDMEFVKITRENSKLYVYYICPKHRDVGVQKTLLESMRRKKVGCPYCIGRNKTTESFKNELYSINPNIRIRGEYIDAKTLIECECLIDHTIWFPTPNGLLHGQGCPECGRIASNKNSTKTNEEFIAQLKLINPNIIPLQEYIQAKIKILVMCAKCGHKWMATPDILLQGIGCSECSKKRKHNIQAKSNEQFLKELAKVNPMLLPLDPYYNDHTKMRVQCLKHNYIWSAMPNKILHRYTGCPKCSIYNNEQKIVNFLEEMNYNVILQKRFKDCRDKYALPFDIFVEKYNLLIEYQGEQHYKPIRRGSMTDSEALEQLQITQYHDKIKLEYCQSHNIPLICVPYWEQNNIEAFLKIECEKYNIILTEQNNYIVNN